MNRYFLTFAFVVIAFSTKAQQHRFGTWSELTLTHDLTKKWNVSAAAQWRKYPAAYNSQYIVEAGVTRELAKRLKAGLGYRFTQLDIGHEQRVQVDLSYQLRFKGFQLTDRARFQYEWNYRDRFLNYVRNKTTLKYRKLKDITPLLAAEAFYRAGYGYRFVEQFRFFAGADYSFNKRLELSLQWVHTQEVQVSDPVTSDVAYIGLTYDIQKSKKKEKEKVDAQPEP